MRRKKKSGAQAVSSRPTIAELEAILDAEEEAGIEILPNGKVRLSKKSRAKGAKKPLTMRENLGGEYAA